MNTIEIIEKKKFGHELSKEEIDYIVEGYTNDSIPDYQISSLLMAIRLNDMSESETVNLTDAIVRSGETIDLSAIEGFKVDKHSTGGIGDKVSLIIAPILAALDVPVAKMSGRGLGITGGTVDKLESVKGFKVEITKEEFIKQVNETKIAIIGQSGNLVPADKKLYALRDVTGTVDSIPLIASSIMSKKIASGADGIVLDVKCGSGAFMKTKEEAAHLAETMIKIGNGLGRKVSAIITDMNQPIGNSIGNKLEVMEAYDFFKNVNSAHEGLVDVSVKVSAMMYQLATDATEDEAIDKVHEVINNGLAQKKFEEFLEAQGGDMNDVKIPETKYIIELKSIDEEGYLAKLNAELVGKASLLLGAGRRTKEDVIDYDAGVELVKMTGSKVEIGDVLCRIYTNKDDYKESMRLLYEAFEIKDKLKFEEMPFSIIKTIPYVKE